MSEANSSPVGVIVTAFAVGALVGAGVALLYAPQSGKDTRDLLARKTSDLKAKAQVALNDAKDAIREKRSQIIGAMEADV